MEEFSYSNNNKVLASSMLYILNRAGSAEVGTDFHIIRDSSYPYCVLHYAVKGKGFVKVSNTQVQVNEGNLFILKPFEAHEYWTSEEEPLSFNWIEFYGGNMQPFIESILDKTGLLLDTEKSTAVNYSICQLIKYLKTNSFVDEFKISEMLYSILLKLYSFSSSSQNANSKPVIIKDWVDKVEKYVNNNLSSELTIEVLSKVANFNPTYFAKIFKNEVGYTPAKYVLEKRIQKAYNELEKTEKSIDIIAEICGFCSPSHFISVFKSIEGQTPSEYRRYIKMYGISTNDN